MVDLFSRIRWVATGLIIVLVAVVSLVWLNFRQTNAVESAASWVSHTNNILLHTSSLQYLLNENQALVRDYAFTGNEQKSEQIERNEQKLDSVLKQLMELTIDNPFQVSKLSEAKRLIGKRIEFSRKQVSNYRDNGLDAFVKTASAGEGIALMDSIRNVLNSIQEHESRLLAERNMENSSGQKTLDWLKSGLILFLLILIFTVLLFIGEQLKAQKKVAALLKGRNQSLESEVEKKSREIIGTLERINDFFITLDKNGKILYVNQRAAQLMDRKPEELTGQVIWEAFPRFKGTDLYDNCIRAAQDLKPFILNHLTPNRGRWLEVYGYPDEHGISLFLHDFTERKEAELHLSAVNRLYFFISQINQMIVRTSSREQLFRDSCEIAVNAGGFALVWIGEPDGNGKIVEKYSAGEKKGYLEYLPEITIHDEPAGRGPSGIAFRERRPVMGPDIQHAPQSAPWREYAIRFGLKSVICFPLIEDGVTVGVINFYSDKQNYFDEKEVELLTEVTGDISYALDNISREEKRVEAGKLIQERNLFISTLIDASPDIIYIYDLKKRTNIYVNREVYRGLGYSENEIREMGDKVLVNLIHPEDHERYLEETEPVYPLLADGKVNKLEFRLCDKKGEWHWFYGREMVYKRDEEGNPEQIFGLMTDITDLKRIERELRGSEEKYRSMVDRISDGFIALDKNWKYIYVNSQIEKMVHKPASELIGRNVWEVFPDAIGSNTYKTFMKAMEEQVYIRSVDYYPPLNLWQENHIYPSPEGLAVFILDISQRKKVQQDLESSEEKYRILFESSPLPLWIYSIKNFRYLEVNQAAIEFYGYSREEFLKMTIMDIRPASDRQQVKAAAEKLYHGFHAAGQWNHQKKDGSLVRMSIFSHETVYQNEAVRLVIAVPVPAEN